jgi:hypothetical protein
MKTPQNFTEFWDFYVAEHSRPQTRLLHFVGSLAGVVILIWLIALGRWYLFPLALVPSYGLAWIGHFCIEHNRPATFKYPFWSFLGDWKMVWMMLTGKMNKEVQRVCGKNSKNPILYRQ